MREGFHGRWISAHCVGVRATCVAGWLRLIHDPAGPVDVLDAATPSDEAHGGLASPLRLHAELLRGTALPRGAGR